MTIEASGAISLGTTAGTNRSISAEFGGTQPHSISEYYRDGSYSDGINIPSGETGIPASGQIAFSDFHGTASLSATTYYSSLEADSYYSDQNAIAYYNLEVFYLNGNIDVRADSFADGDASTLSPANNTTLYRISGAPSGYTVKLGTITVNSGGDHTTTGTTIGTSATSIPTSTSLVRANFRVESGGGFDDPGAAFTNISGSLIFEKSGSTTFTYNWTIILAAETEGSGGE